MSTTRPNRLAASGPRPFTPASSVAALTLDPTPEHVLPGAASLAQLDRINRAAAGTTTVYGVNTGFGKLASLKIAPEDTATLQRNMARMMLALTLPSLGRRASGMRWEIGALREAMLAAVIPPVIPRSSRRKALSARRAIRRV